jgi:D-beta-D-heptose 7-phosphate kinase/D-beta-D-heptose 1-phosphate adenosyltransferase
VDLVVPFSQDTPLELIERVRPAVLVKGGDYVTAEIVGRDYVEAEGGEVIIVPLVPGHSTSQLIEQSKFRAPAK